MTSPILASLKKKTCYMGHCRFLPQNIFLHTNKSFDGNKEFRPKPKLLSGDEVLEQLKNIDQPTFGKVDEHGRKRKRSASYLN